MLPRYKVPRSTGFNVIWSYELCWNKRVHLLFFWTASAADCYWPELHSLLPHANSPPTYSDRLQAVVDQPHITDWYFVSELTDFVNHWLYNTLDAHWHWYRVEYLARGSTHAHGCAKLNNDPGICMLVQKAASAWLATQDPETLPDQRLIEDGEKARATALQYIDWLVTTCNDFISDHQWRLPTPHPCSTPFDKITNYDDDYHNLVNSVQRHTHCSTAYCLRRKPGQQDVTCRFEYPRETQTSSTINFEKLSNGTICAPLTTKRNDSRLNSHNRVMLQHWRANVDLQIIVVDVQACARYMSKYAAKSEPRSQSVQSLYKSCVDRFTDTSDASKLLRNSIVRSVGERDFSAQETLHKKHCTCYLVFLCTLAHTALSPWP